MQFILFGAVFLCLLVAANAVGLGATCTPATGVKGDCDDANAICPESAKCECKNGYMASGTSCAAIDDGKVDAACTVAKPCEGTNVVCTGGFCACKTGFSGNKGDDDCTANNKGSTLGHISIWMVCMTFVTVSLVVYVI